jgi:hypothetical protein
MNRRLFRGFKESTKCQPNELPNLASTTSRFSEQLGFDLNQIESFQANGVVPEFKHVQESAR